ncbi:MAG: hypothetical protein IPK82_28775 [Polyangiaceae bacterium]|nr:hypothetical protein [Polyangiaceae bacterium]
MKRAFFLHLALTATFASLLAACSSTTAAVFPTGEGGPRLRRPDGVVIDPESAPPLPRDRASAEDGIMTLRSPLGPEVAIDTVRELFRRVVARDTSSLSELFTQSAQPISYGPGGYGVPDRAWDWWVQRSNRLDYTKLSGEVLFREADIEVFRAQDALETPPHPAIRTEALDDSDVILRVTMLAGTNGTDRYFGDVIVFWLRRDADTYKIYRQLEDFQLQ